MMILNMISSYDDVSYVLILRRLTSLACDFVLRMVLLFLPICLLKAHRGHNWNV